MTTATLSCSNCQHFSSESWGDGWNEPRETQEYCNKHQWEFEEPIPSPVTDCKHFDFTISDRYKQYQDGVIDLDDLLLEAF